MKSASCWFADEWCVTSTAIGESVEKRVLFEMKKIFLDKIEELDVEVNQSEKTIIILQLNCLMLIECLGEEALER